MPFFIATALNCGGFFVTQKETPVRDRLPRKTGSGLAASWNVMTSMGVGGSAFAEGQTPDEDATGYARRSAIYKELSKTKSITNKMLAAGKSFMDQEAEQTEVAIREVIQDEEQYIITGNASNNALEFNGLKAYITTNVIDDANNALGFRTVLLDSAIEKIVRDYGVRPTAILCSYGMKKTINQSLAGDVRVNLDQTNTVGAGVDLGFYQSMIGKLPFVPTFAIADDSSTYSGVVVSDIYVITENARGQSAIYMATS